MGAKPTDKTYSYPIVEVACMSSDTSNWSPNFNFSIWEDDVVVTDVIGLSLIDSRPIWVIDCMNSLHLSSIHFPPINSGGSI